MINFNKLSFEIGYLIYNLEKVENRESIKRILKIINYNISIDDMKNGYYEHALDYNKPELEGFNKKLEELGLLMDYSEITNGISIYEFIGHIVRIEIKKVKATNNIRYLTGIVKEVSYINEIKDFRIIVLTEIDRISFLEGSIIHLSNISEIKQIGLFESTN